MTTRTLGEPGDPRWNHRSFRSMKAARDVRPERGAPAGRSWPARPGGGLVAGAGNARRWAILAVLCVSVFLAVVDNTIVNVALPSISRQLHATISDLQWIVDAY